MRGARNGRALGNDRGVSIQGGAGRHARLERWRGRRPLRRTKRPCFLAVTGVGFFHSEWRAAGTSQLGAMESIARLSVPLHDGNFVGGEAVEAVDDEVDEAVSGVDEDYHGF